jgi:hypothetical protein
VSLTERNIHKPNTAASLISFKVGVVVVKESKYGSDEDGDTLLV